ncbi:MAG: prepilin peptidase [Chloroflexi bacterium]|nr:prepilin peptidase [Chloroflexota bacterium]
MPRSLPYSSLSPLTVAAAAAAVAVLSMLAYLQHGFSQSWAILSAYSCLFVAIAAADLQHRTIPNKLIYWPAPFVLLVAVIADPSAPLWGLANALIGGAAGFGLLALVAIIDPSGMGWGDVKLAGLAGLATGFPLVVIALALSVFGAGVLALLLLVFRLKGRRDVIPFGPFLGLGTVATLLWGNVMVAWLARLATG